jgi:DNA-binding NarL/FixJ family response regulator
VVVADYQSDVRYALRALLQLVRDLNSEVVGEAADADTLHRLLDSLAADLLLLDWHLPGLPEPDRLVAIKTQRPTLKIVVLSGTRELRSAAMAAGAHAFYCKLDSVEPLLVAIRVLRS